MSSRMGRPTKNEEKRDKTLNIRLTEEEKSDIQYCSEKLNLSRTDTIVYGIGLIKETIKKG